MASGGGGDREPQHIETAAVFAVIEPDGAGMAGVETAGVVESVLFGIRSDSGCRLHSLE